MVHGPLLQARPLSLPLSEAGIQQLYEDEGITVIEKLDSSSSHYVAHVRTADGQEALLKAVNSDQGGEYEIITLRIWDESAFTPRVLKILAPGIHLREWVTGEQIDTLPEHGAEVAEEIGRVLRQLHLPVSPEARQLPSILDWLNEQVPFFQQSQHLSSTEQEIAIRILRHVNANPGPEVVLHGDVYYRNILYNGEKLMLIDPRGKRGPAAFDIGCYVCMTPSADPLSLLARALRGYGESLLNASELSLVLTLRAVERFRGEHGLSGQEQQLRYTANKLLEAGVGQRS
jgi:streptomycin 6-kinase